MCDASRLQLTTSWNNICVQLLKIVTCDKLPHTITHLLFYCLIFFGRILNIIAKLQNTAFLRDIIRRKYQCYEH